MEDDMRFNVLAMALSIASVMVVSGCTKEVSYSKDIKPILDTSCIECHDGKGEGSEESGLILVTYDDLMQGTKFGQVVVPGDSESSTFYRLVGHKADPKIQMPPHHSDTVASKRMQPLSDKQIEKIKNWIDAGAKNN
jgi:cytochrome c553